MYRSNQNTARFIVITLFIFVSSLVANDTGEKSHFKVSPVMEMGFLSTISHTIQFGESGTQVDYRDEGGQDLLYAFTRFSIDFEFGKRHKMVMLYQPLQIESENVIEQDMIVDSVRFTAGTPMAFKYSFPFYRLSYLYDFMEEDHKELAVGISMQIRNANITFESLDGEQLTTNRDIGPVPILKFRHRLPLNEQFWWGSEIDGFYAPVSYLNGSDEEVVGAILDASIRVGMKIKEKGNTFINLRYLGGGAVGTSDDDLSRGSDGYVDNWLHFMTVSAGFSWHLL